jgi:predicted DNA-binding protein
MKSMTSIFLSKQDRERLERLQLHLGTKSMAATIRLAIQAYLGFFESPSLQDENHELH